MAQKTQIVEPSMELAAAGWRAGGPSGNGPSAGWGVGVWGVGPHQRDLQIQRFGRREVEPLRLHSALTQIPENRHCGSRLHEEDENKMRKSNMAESGRGWSAENVSVGVAIKSLGTVGAGSMGEPSGIGSGQCVSKHSPMNNRGGGAKLQSSSIACIPVAPLSTPLLPWSCAPPVTHPSHLSQLKVGKDHPSSFTACAALRTPSCFLPGLWEFACARTRYAVFLLR